MAGACIRSASPTFMTANGSSPERSTSTPRRFPASAAPMGWRSAPRWSGSGHIGRSFVRDLMSPPSPDDEFAPPTAQDIALAILLEAENLSQLMELHYYANEPGFLEIARVIAALPEGDREALRAFL